MQLPLAKYQHVIQAFAPNTAYKTLTDRVRQWGLDWRPFHFNPGCSGSNVERAAILVVVVPDDVSRPAAISCRFTQPLRGPELARMSRYAEVNNAP